MRIVYFSPVAWHSFAQRSHRFVEWFHARHDATVLWVEPYPTRLPELADVRRACVGSQVLRGPAHAALPAWLTIVRPAALPIEPLPGSASINRLLWYDAFKRIDAFVSAGECLIAVGKPSELALQLLRQHPGTASIFDVMDDFAGFYRGLSRRAMARRMAAVADCATRIVVSSTALAHSLARYRSKLSIVRNACATEGLPSPPSFKPGAATRTVFGYVGAIAHWFDWKLVLGLAKAYPSALVRLIGPLYCPPPAPLPGNVELLPACSNEAGLQSMEEFYVGLIPFKQTDLTAAVDPIKYYEYRATGLPVLSTAFGEMVFRRDLPGVFLIDGQQDLPSRVQSALAYRAEAGEVQAFRAQNSWAARFDAEYSLAPG
jgi:hypothetical protein